MNILTVLLIAVFVPGLLVSMAGWALGRIEALCNLTEHPSPLRWLVIVPLFVAFSPWLLILWVIENSLKLFLRGTLWLRWLFS